jgi:hypothetical protein
MANKNTKSIELKEVSLYSVTNEQYNFTKAAVGFAYYENIFQPFVSAVLNVADSGGNFISKIPIQGGERVVIKVVDVEKNEYEYEMYVWKIYNRTFTKSMQNYNLALVSKEALYNEGVRLTEVLKGTPDAIVGKILTDYLKTEKEIYSERAKYQVQFFPNGKKAHHIIQSVSQKAVPQASKAASGDASKTTSGGQTGLSGDTNKASGTAGFLFFENSAGFNFNSIDYYFSTGDDEFRGQQEVATYESKPNQDAPERLVIEEYKFTNEVDLLDQMRSGTFASHVVTYNWSTGFYEEFRYNLQENFGSMAHLGSQEKLGATQELLSVNPTRVMTVLVDHETWHNEETPGSPDEKDNGGNGGANYPDYQKHWLAQSIARRYFMENQKLEVTVPGNMELRVGDKIKVLLPSMSAETVRQTDQLDRENSGTYLISALSHNNVFLNSSTCTTKLELIRDIYGMKDYSSNVK